MIDFTCCIRLYFTSLLFVISCVDASHADVLGKYAIYERGDEVWLVGELIDTDDSEPQSSESAIKQSSIVVVTCSSTGKCQAQTARNKREIKWLPVLTWQNDVPVLLSTDFKSGITMETPERKVVAITGLESVRGVFSSWQLSGGDIPELILSRNREHFGVTREMSGGGMGTAMGDIIELKLWDVLIGDKQSDLTCSAVTFKSRTAVANQKLKMLFRIDF